MLVFPLSLFTIIIIIIIIIIIHSFIHSTLQSDKYQVSYRYGIFSWWCTNICQKHVQKNKKVLRKFVHQVDSIYKILLNYFL